MRDYSDNIGIYEAFDPPKTAKDYGLLETENYFVWTRPTISDVPVVHKERAWVAGWRQIVYDLNERNVEKSHKTNIIAVYQIKTGQLMWHDAHQYNENKMKGHGYNVTLKDIRDHKSPGLYRVNVNSVTPIIIIPADDDEVLKGWDRIIVQVSYHGGWHSHKLGNAKIQRLTYNNSFDGKATMNMSSKEHLEVANKLLQDEYDVATIARTLAQPEYVENILNHIHREEEKELDDSADISVKTLTYKANVKTGSGAMKLTEYPVEIIKVSDDGLRAVVNRLGNAVAYDEIWIDDIPLTDGLGAHTANLHKKMRPNTAKGVSAEAKNYYNDHPPFLMAVVNKDEEFMFGLTFHPGTGARGKKPFEPSKFYIEFASNPVPYEAKKSTNSPLHPTIFKLLKDNDVLGYITTGLPNTLGKETAFHIVYQDAVWPKSMTNEMDGTKKDKSYKVNSSNTPHSGQSPEDKRFFAAYMIHALTSRNFNDDEDDINAGGYAP